MGGTAIRTYSGAKAPLFKVAISPDRQLLAAVGEKGTVALFDAAKGTLIKRLQGHEEAVKVWGVVFHPQGQWFATAGDDRRILFWLLPGGELMDKREMPGQVRALAISQDGKWLVSGDDCSGWLQSGCGVR